LGAASLRLLDVGGGLGVDYLGAASDEPSSMDYSAQEYANDVIYAASQACSEAEVPPPDIITESGRSMVAYHSMLVFDVIGVNRDQSVWDHEPCSEEDHAVLHALAETADGITAENVNESYHDLVHGRDEAASLFSLGYLDLRGRAKSERIFHTGCRRVATMLRQLGEPLEYYEELRSHLIDTYFGNFSVFQSAPDAWAVKQVFPIIPIHRLAEEPTREAVLADLTCDSDGRIDHFIGDGEEQSTVRLHPWTGSRYLLGLFLIGAYQEILGDLHNLFGDTDAVHVRLDAHRGYTIEHLVEGDDVRDVLSYVQYDRRDLAERVRKLIERGLRDERISLEDSALLRRRYRQGLSEYTYLRDES
jgi:arginine decarboxylase